MNNDIYQKLIYKLSKKYNISDLEVERIVDSEFKVLSEHISNRSLETLNMIYLGKFTPPTRRIKREKKTNEEQIKTDIPNS